jgi:hypothetical protein
MRRRARCTAETFIADSLVTAAADFAGHPKGSPREIDSNLNLIEREVLGRVQIQGIIEPVLFNRASGRPKF